MFVQQYHAFQNTIALNPIIATNIPTTATPTPAFHRKPTAPKRAQANKNTQKDAEELARAVAHENRLKAQKRTKKRE